MPHRQRPSASQFVFFQDRGAAFSWNAGRRYRGADLAFDGGAAGLRWILAQYSADVESGR